MNLFKKSKYILVSFILILSIIGCDLFNTTESTKSKYSTININVPSSRGIVDDISSYQLTVTGSDFEDVINTFSDNSLSIDILAGTERTFTLLIFGEDETVALFKGEKTIDLESGVDVDLELEANQSVRYVSYDANIDDADTITGEVPENIYYADGEDVTISVPGNTGALVNGDYLFVGWNTEADGSGTTYFEDDEITLSDSDITLYSIWGFSYYEFTVEDSSFEEDSDDTIIPFLTLYKNEVSFIIKNNSVYESYDDTEDDTEEVITTSYINEIYRGKDFTFTKSEGNIVITLNNVLVEKDDDYDVDSEKLEEISEDLGEAEDSVDTEEIEYDEMKVVFTMYGDETYNIDIAYIDDDSDEAGDSITGTYTAYNKSSSAEILSVDVDGDGTVEEFSVTDNVLDVYFEGEIDETKVSPIITVSLGATISPASGEELDFSTDVDFTVTAEDGTEAIYTVLASYSLTYDLNGGTGTLDSDSMKYNEGDDVYLLGSYGLSQSGLVFAGWATSVDSEELLSDPYTMPAEDVTLYAIWENTEDTIDLGYLELIITGGEGPGVNSLMNITILDGEISWFYKESDDDLYQMMYEGDQHSVQVSGDVVTIEIPVSNHEFVFTFSNNITTGTFETTYSESDDSEVLEYYGTFSAFSESNRTEISEFNIEEDETIYYGSIDGLNILIEDYYEDITDLVPTITIPLGATISPESGVAQDFTDPIEYTVTAQDGTTAVYTVTVENTEVTPQ